MIDPGANDTVAVSDLNNDGHPAIIHLMLLIPQTRLVIKQPVQHVRGLARRRGDHLRMVGAELVGDMGIEGHARFIPVTGVDVAERLASTAGPIILPVRG
jgi:hypothetical protein